MTPQSLTVLYGAILHLASLAAISTLIGVGAIAADVGVPLLTGLIGGGIGAAVALIPPGNASVPSGLPGAPAAGASATATRVEGP